MMKSSDKFSFDELRRRNEQAPAKRASDLVPLPSYYERYPEHRPRKQTRRQIRRRIIRGGSIAWG